MDLSIVIPAFDEAGRIGASLERVLAFLAERGEPWEVLVVDDGSRDATAELVSGFRERGVELVRLPANRGKGAALRAGVARTRGGRVLLSDADLSTPMSDLPRLEAHLAEADLVLGSRSVASSRITRRQPLYRVLMGKTFNLLIRLLGVRGIHDTQCGFKLLRGDVARSLFADLTVDRFAYDVELVWLARRRGLSVAEVGVSWENSPDSRVHVVHDSLRMLRDVFLMRWRHRREAR